MIQNRMQVEAASRVTVGSTQTLSKAVLGVAVGLTVGFVTFILSTMAGMQLGNTLLRPSPFIPFEAFWPGQSVESLRAYVQRLPQGQITCTSGMSPSPGIPYVSPAVYRFPGDNVPRFGLICAFAPENGLFRWVTLRIENGRVQQLVLLSDVLPEDMLLLYWGMPDAISRMGADQRFNLFWKRSSYSAMATVMEATSVVRIVTLTANP